MAQLSEARAAGQTGHIADTNALHRKANYVFDVVDFGAVGDGTTDDTAAIQAAIDAAETAGGGDAYLPPGDYLITTTLTMKDQVRLIGAGGWPTSAAGKDGVTSILASNINHIALGGVTGATIRSLSLTNTGTLNTSGAGLYVNGGNTANLTVEDVHITGLEHALQVTATGLLTHVRFLMCQFAFNGNTHWLFADGAVLNSATVESCRFEQNGSGFGAVEATGSAAATGSMVWKNCVFEAMNIQYTVECGANVRGWKFDTCHFESNAASVANGADIHIGAGTGHVSVIDCTFAGPGTSATSFHNIVKASGSIIGVTTSGNVVVSSHAGWTGFASLGTFGEATFDGNVYLSGTAGDDPLVSVVSPIRRNEDVIFAGSTVADQIIKSVETTDATVTAIWSETNVNTGAYGSFRSHYLVADVTCVDDTDASVHAGYTVRVLVTGTTTTLTSRGTDSETGVESDAGLTAAFAVSNDSNGTLKLNVTGLAATNLTWVAVIRRISSYA